MLLALVRKGLAREEAYRWVQRCGMQAMNGADFRTEVTRDPDISRHLTATEISELFDLRHHLRYEEALLRRAFGGDEWKSGN